MARGHRCNYGIRAMNIYYTLCMKRLDNSCIVYACKTLQLYSIIIYGFKKHLGWRASGKQSSIINAAFVTACMLSTLQIVSGRVQSF